MSYDRANPKKNAFGDPRLSGYVVEAYAFAAEERYHYCIEDSNGWGKPPWHWSVLDQEVKEMKPNYAYPLPQTRGSGTAPSRYEAIRMAHEFCEALLNETGGVKR